PRHTNRSRLSPSGGEAAPQGGFNIYPGSFNCLFDEGVKSFEGPPPYAGNPESFSRLDCRMCVLLLCHVMPGAAFRARGRAYGTEPGRKGAPWLMSNGKSPPS